MEITDELSKQQQCDRIDNFDKIGLMYAEFFQSTIPEESEYDPFKNPPNIQQAESHRKASLIGFDLLTKDSKICPCCFHPIEKAPIPILFQPSQLLFLGIGFTMYFSLLKLIILLLTVLLFISQFCWLWVRIKYCQQNLCNNLFVATFKLSDYSLLEKETESQSLLITILVALFLIAAIFYIKKYCDLARTAYQKQQNHQESYTIMLNNLPKQYSEDDLKFWVTEKFNLQPQACTSAYDLKQYNETFKRRDLLTISMHKNRILANKNSDPKSINFSVNAGLSETLILDKKQKEILNSIEIEDQILNKYSSNNDYWKKIGVAFISFEDAEETSKILKENQSDSFLKKIKQKISNTSNNQLKYSTDLEKKKTLANILANMSIEAAPSPKELIWQNLLYVNKNPLLLYIVLAGVCFSLLVFSLMLFYKLTIILKSHDKSEQYLTILLVMLANYGVYNLLLHVFVIKFLEWRKHYSRSDEETTYFIVYGYFNIFYTCLVPYCTVFNSNELLLLLIFFVMGVNSLSQPLSHLCGIQVIYRKIYFQYIRSLEPRKNPYTQNYVNTIFEGEHFHLGHHYQYLIRAAFISCFFAHPLPFGFAIYLIGLTLQFFITKFILARQCQQPNLVTRRILDQFIKLLGVLPAIYIIGAMRFLNTVTEDQLENNVIFLALAIIFKAISFVMFLYFSKNTLRYIPNEKYKESQFSFNSYYEIENPIVKNTGEIISLIKSSRKRKLTAQDQHQLKSQESDIELPEIFITSPNKFKTSLKQSNASNTGRSQKFMLHRMLSLVENDEFQLPEIRDYTDKADRSPSYPISKSMQRI